MKTFNKLVRDKIPEIIAQEGTAYSSRILDVAEYRQELAKKIVEEANEVLAAADDNQELIKEIGDVLEVIDAIVASYQLDKAEIGRVKEERKAKRGGFEQRIFLESTD